MVKLGYFSLLAVIAIPNSYSQDCAAPTRLDTFLVQGNTVVVADCVAQERKYAGEFCVEVTGKDGSGIYRMNRDGRVIGFLKKPSYLGASQLVKEETSGKGTRYAETLQPQELLDPAIELMNFFHPKGSERDHFVDRPKSPYEKWIGGLRASVTEVRKKYGCKIPVLPPARPGDAQKHIRPLPYPAGSSAN